MKDFGRWFKEFKLEPEPEPVVDKYNLPDGLYYNPVRDRIETLCCCCLEAFEWPLCVSQFHPEDKQYCGKSPRCCP